MGDYGNGPYYGGGGSGGGGGGFVSGSPYQGSQGSPGAGRKQPSASLRPVTIRQIIDAAQAHTDAEFTIDGAEPTQLTFVAQVVNCQTQATNIVCKMTDATGEIEVRQWLDSAEDGERKKSDIGDMAWVRVMGSIKSFSGKRHVTAIKIRPVTDFNEIYFHQLEALSVHLYYTKGPIGEAGAVGGGAYGIHGPNGPSAYSSGTTSTAPKDDGGLGPQYADLPQLHRQIVMFMKNSVDGDQGINVGAIARGVASSGVDAIAISAAMDQLMDDGHIYATIDEEHFALS